MLYAIHDTIHFILYIMYDINVTVIRFYFNSQVSLLYHTYTAPP